MPPVSIVESGPLPRLAGLEVGRPGVYRAAPADTTCRMTLLPTANSDKMCDINHLSPRPSWGVWEPADGTAASVRSNLTGPALPQRGGSGTYILDDPLPMMWEGTRPAPAPRRPVGDGARRVTVE